MSKKFIFSFIAIIFIAVCITIIQKKQADPYSQISQIQSDLKEYRFFLLNNKRELAPVSLKDLEGKGATLSSVSDKWQLVNFGYMFCPDICPINLKLMSDLKQDWLSKGHQDIFDITHITFDPERDTLDRLKPYLNYIDASYIGLTGDLENIRQVAQQLSTVFIHEKPDEYGNYFITHSDSIALLNPKGEYIGLFKGPYNKDEMLLSLEKIIK